MIRLRPRLRSHQKISGPIVRGSRVVSVLCSLGTPLDPHKYLESPTRGRENEEFFFSPAPLTLYFFGGGHFLYLRTEIFGWKPNPAPGGRLNGRPAGCEQYGFGMKSFSCPVPRSDAELHRGAVPAGCTLGSGAPGARSLCDFGVSRPRAVSGMRGGCGLGGPSHPKY